MKATSGLRPRRLAEVVPQRMSEEPVVILTGPRTVGKSTLLAALAAEFDRPVLDLDRPDARAAAASDPGFIVSGPGPVLIDEFQHVPEILDAIKAELNTDTRPWALRAHRIHEVLGPAAGGAVADRAGPRHQSPAVVPGGAARAPGELHRPALGGPGSVPQGTDILGVRSAPDRVPGRAAREDVGDRARGHLVGRELGFGREPGQVRRDDRVGQLERDVAGRRRFGVEDVEGGAREVTAFQRGTQGVEVRELTAAA